MQYTPHYNLNLPEGTDIVNPLIQDNPNYSAIDTALYDNKLRVIGNATHTKTGTNHSIVLADSDINAFKFVATGDYATGDTFTVDGVTVTARVADGSSIPAGAFKINSTVEAILDGTILNLINVDGTKAASGVSYDNSSSGLTAVDVQGAIDEINGSVDTLNEYVAGSGTYDLMGVASKLISGWGTGIVLPFVHDTTKSITITSAQAVFQYYITDLSNFTINANERNFITLKYAASGDFNIANSLMSFSITLS